MINAKLLEVVFDKLCEVELTTMETAKYQEKATQLEQIEEQLLYENDIEVRRTLMVKQKDLYTELNTMIILADVESVLNEEYKYE
mgnify:CR=1 FL=1